MSGAGGGPRALAEAVRAGVAAALGRDEHGLGEAVTRLAATDAEPVRLVVGHVVRSLVEELHPDGLDADDVGELLRAADTEARWCRDVDATVLLSVVAGALGVHPQEEEDGARPVPVPQQDVTRHALLLVASLLRRRSGAAGAPDVEPYLSASVDELRRAQTIELP